MTARYSLAEKAAAKRIGFAPALKGDAGSPKWLADFRRIVVVGSRSDARCWRAKAKEATKKAERCDRFAVDAALVARAIAREQRRAARS